MPAWAEKKISVLPFEILTQKEDMKQFGIGTMDSLTNALSNVPEFIMVDRGQLNTILKEQAFQKQLDQKDKEAQKQSELKEKEAKQLLEEARIIHPYYIPAIEDLSGRLLLLSGQPKQALYYYQGYLRGNENDSMALYTIGRLYAQIGNTSAAWKSLELSLKNGFNYSWVLKFDPVWNAYRQSPKWKALTDRYPNNKLYSLKKL